LIQLSVTSKGFTKFWGKFFSFVLLVLTEFSQELKNFKFMYYLKALIENYFKLSNYFLKNFEKTKYQNIIFFFYSNLSKLACKGMSHKCVLCLLKIALQNFV
jgi:hypothetical protein